MIPPQSTDRQLGTPGVLKAAFVRRERAGSLRLSTALFEPIRVVPKKDRLASTLSPRPTMGNSWSWSIALLFAAFRSFVVNAARSEGVSLRRRQRATR
jgi:hypothetical protein